MKQQFDAGLSTAPSTVPEDLHRLIEEGFEETEGCVFLRRLAKGAATVRPSLFPARTGRECFVNKIQIDEYADSPGGSELLAIGVAFAKQLVEALRTRREHFVVTVASDGETCSIRFHKSRPGESWLTDDLDSYREESILALDV